MSTLLARPAGVRSPHPILSLSQPGVTLSTGDVWVWATPHLTCPWLARWCLGQSTVLELTWTTPRGAPQALYCVSAPN